MGKGIPIKSVYPGELLPVRYSQWENGRGSLIWLRKSPFMGKLCLDQITKGNIFRV